MSAARLLFAFDERPVCEGRCAEPRYVGARSAARLSGWRLCARPLDYARGVPSEVRQVAPPIAPREIQSYYFAAQRFMAAFALALGSPGEARVFWNGEIFLRRTIIYLFLSIDFYQPWGEAKRAKTQIVAL